MGGMGIFWNHTLRLHVLTYEKIVFCLPRVPRFDQKWEVTKFNLYIGFYKQIIMKTFIEYIY